MSTTDDTNAARRGSGSNDLLGPLVDAAMAAAKEVAYGTCATVANHLEGDYGTWDDWADLVERVAARAVAAERERCAKLADDFANRAWNDARSEAWSDEFELLARNIRGA